MNFRTQLMNNCCCSDSVEPGLCKDNYELEQRRRKLVAKASRASSPQHWQTMAELGWLGLQFAENLRAVSAAPRLIPCSCSNSSAAGWFSNPTWPQCHTRRRCPEAGTPATQPEAGKFLVPSVIDGQQTAGRSHMGRGRTSRHDLQRRCNTRNPGQPRV